MHGIRSFRTVLVMLVSFACPALHAQDTLVYVNGERIVGRVEEIGVDLVRYRTNSSDTQVLIVAEKRDLARIKLNGGQEFIFANVSTDVPATEVFMARGQAISVDVLAPALDHITISYEHRLGQRSSLVGKVGYIGLWQRDYYSDKLTNQGFLITLGPKFLLPKPAKRLPSARDRHPLSGWYLRPELMFSYWADRNYGYRGYYSGWDDKTFYSSAALNLVIGTQVLLGERFTFDIHGGLGYGVLWQNGRPSAYNDKYYHSQDYAYTHVFLGGYTPLCVSGGVLFGYLF